MSYNFPEGARFQYSTTFGAAKTVTIASNANPAVLTAASHGLVDGDEFLFNSGWEDAKDSIFQADQLTADTLGVLGLNTTNSVFYPSGTGIGTIQKITDWTDIPQVLTVGGDGGGARFTSVNPVASRNGIQIPTGFEPAKTTLGLGHDPANATYQAMLDISRTFQKCAFRIVGGGGTTYGYGYMVVSEQPKMQNNQVNMVDCVVSFQGRVISY